MHDQTSLVHRREKDLPDAWVEEGRRNEQHFRQKALTDSLTGLLNRRPAVSCLNRAIDEAAEGAPSSLVLLDLDHFKSVNDTLGHEAGDDALRRVAQVLTAFVRDSDKVCRWGGEEFLVVMPAAEEAEAIETAERLRMRLADASLAASFGVAQIDHDDTVTSWVRRADDAMYVAKREGRNTVRVAARVVN